MTAAWSVEQGDAVAKLRELPSESVDLVITDYAYPSLERHRARGTTTRLSISEGSSNPWFQTFPNQRLPDLMGAMYRVLRPQRHAWLLCDAETSRIVQRVAEIEGFYVWNELVWLKTTQGTPPGEWGPARIGMGFHGRRCTERLLFLEKRTKPYVGGDLGFLGLGPSLQDKGHPPGKGRKLRDLGMAEVIPCPSVVGGFPTEKPVWLLRRLIEQSTQPGELVADPFCGSGSTGEAALSCGRAVKLYDLDPNAVAIATARLQGVSDGR